MRLTLILMILSVFTAYSATYAQKTKLNLKVQNAQIKQVLQEIEEQSDFSFMYDNNQVDVERTVSINVNELTIDKILEKLFSETNTNFKVVNRQILLFNEAANTGLLQQSKPVSGKITDATGATLPGVSIVVKGTTNGTISDSNGFFTIGNVPENAILQFSFVGMKTQEVNVSGQSTINLVLEEETIGIEEVVAVGYGNQKKVNLTGAVDVISNKDLSNRQSATVSQLLQGLSPGTNFTISGTNGFEPGAAMDITIRGMGSLNGGRPYTLINGVPGDINFLNPEDIESISILKDAASSAIYGAKAAYGVILVTTKKGGKNEKMSVTYSGSVSLVTPPVLPDGVDSYTYVKVQNEAGQNKGAKPFGNDQIDRIIAYQNGDWDYLRTTFAPGQTHFGAFAKDNRWNPDLSYANMDWWDYYFGSGINQKHDMSLQGGTKNASYYFSAGYLRQEGLLNLGSDIFNRTNVTGKVDIAVAPWWDFSWEPRLTDKSRVSPTNLSNAYFAVSRAYPFTPLYDGLGEHPYETHIDEVTKGGDRTVDEIDTWNIFKTEIRPIKGWKINADFAYNYYLGTTTNVTKIVLEHMVDDTWINYRNTPNSIDRLRYGNSYWSTNVYSTFNLDLHDNHHFMAVAGLQFEKGYEGMLNGKKNDMILQDVPSIQTATGTAILTETLAHRATQGYFGRLNYNYKEKYLLESNIRYDGSYVFREGNRWGAFPSFSVGWNIHKENFWGDLGKYLNTMKIRGSWGQLGNQNINPYSDLELLPLQTGQLDWVFAYGAARPIGYTTAPGIVNENLTWETATTSNLGANMTFLNNKLSVDMEIFQRLTEDMVGPSEAKPGVLGAQSPQANNSTLRTRGWELAVSWRQNLSNGFSYNIGANLSDYTSVVDKYYNPTGTLSTWFEGREIGDLWGWTADDLFITADELTDYRSKVNLTAISTTWNTGDIKILDINNDDKITRGTNTVSDPGDLSVIGNSSPHYIVGMNAGAEYKGFDFSMIWRGVLKKDVFFNSWADVYWGTCPFWWDSVLDGRTLDYFRDTPGTKYVGLYEGDANLNTDAYFPRPYLDRNEEAKNKNTPTTRYLQSGAYFRLQNVQLGYTVPQNVTSKMKLQKIRIAMSGENLITFQKLPKTIDPVAPVGAIIRPVVQNTTEFGEAVGLGRFTHGADRIYSFILTVTY